jgi:hypothetical protein
MPADPFLVQAGGGAGGGTGGGTGGGIAGGTCGGMGSGSRWWHSGRVELWISLWLWHVGRQLKCFVSVVFILLRRVLYVADNSLAALSDVDILNWDTLLPALPEFL